MVVKEKDINLMLVNSLIDKLLKFDIIKKNCGIGETTEGKR
jgi:hypothetical protein